MFVVLQRRMRGRAETRRSAPQDHAAPPCAKYSPHKEAEGGGTLKSFSMVLGCDLGADFGVVAR